MKLTYKLSYIFMVALATTLTSCYNDFDPKQQAFPLIRTLPASANDNTGVQFNGEVIKTGTDPILNFGFTWTEPGQIDPQPKDTFLILLGTDLKQQFSVKVTHKLVAGRGYVVKAFVIIPGKTIYGDGIKFTSKLTSPSLITSFNPSYVLDGDTLTIFGENLHNNPDSELNKVTISGSSAQVLSYTKKSVKVIVPATTQPGPGSTTVDVFYAQPSSNKLTIINPSITSFSPTHGSAGQVVTLKGRFSHRQDYNQILFNGVGAYVISSTSSTLSAYVPSGISGNANITIKVNGKTFTSADNFVVD